jgi:glycosyltransferase involved in cell wall biosynthesis
MPTARRELRSVASRFWRRPFAGSARPRYRTSTAFRRLVGPYISADWYLDAYPDVRAADQDPVQHFLETGAGEGRQPNPLFFGDWYEQEYLGAHRGEDPLEHYARVGWTQGLRFNPIDDPGFISAEYQLGPTEDPLLFLLAHPEVDRVSDWFSRSAYREFNPDVAASGQIPEAHLLAWGLGEQRPCGPGVFVSSEPLEHAPDRATRPRNENERYEFEWRGRRYLVSTSLVSDEVLSQILSQATIDPDVVAAGVRALTSLPQVMATDVDSQIHADYRYLLGAVPDHADAVVILTEVRLGGAEKYGANLAWGLREVGLRDVAIVTTEGSATSDARGLSLDSFAPIRSFPIASIGEELARCRAPATVISHLLLRAGPKYVFVVNSPIALQAITMHGRALASQMRLAATLFCEAPFALGTPLSGLYLRDILPFATVLSDNDTALEPFRQRVGPTFGHRLRSLPTMVDIPDDQTFDRSLAARAVKQGRPSRALWLSRWEQFQKAVDVLIRLAELEPGLTIDAYGPDETDMYESRVPRNIRRLGTVSGPSEIDLAAYDVFLFTSNFEGMPNVVLEMAAAGVPVIASDVGGLRETFSADALEFVPMTGSVDAAARGFQASLARLGEASALESRHRLEDARKQVVRNHGSEQFLTSLAGLLEDLS